MGLEKSDKDNLTRLLQKLEAGGREIKEAKLVTLQNGKQAIQVSYAPHGGNQVIETYDKDTGNLAVYTFKQKNKSDFTIYYDNENTTGMTSKSKKYTIRMDSSGRVLISRSGKKGRENVSEYTYKDDNTRPEKVVEKLRNGTVITRQNGVQTITKRNGKVITKKDNITIDARSIERALQNRKPQGSSSQTVTNQSAKGIAENLKRLIYGSGSDRLAQFRELINSQINSSNFDWIKYEYKKLTNRDLFDDIEKFLKNNSREYATVKRQLAEIQYGKYGVNLDFQNQNSTVSNSYHRGAPHSIVQDGTIITITNKQTGQTRIIDLDKLLRYYANDHERAKLIKMLQQMPGEVLMDIAIETDFLIPSKNETVNVSNGGRCQAAGYYSPSDDTMHIDPDKGVLTMIHETGHSVDFNRANSKRRKNYSSVANDPQFKKIFNQEMRNYIAAGNKKYVYDPSGRSKSDPKTYATANEREMFAECYTLLMTGRCNSAAVITKYFPRTLAYINQKIEQNRSYSDALRH